MIIPQTVNPPGAASFTGPVVDFSALGNLAQDYFQGTQNKRTLDLQNALNDPSMYDANGNLNIQAATTRLLKLGSLPEAGSLMQLGMRQKLLNGTGDDINNPGGYPQAAQPRADTAPFNSEKTYLPQSDTTGISPTGSPKYSATSNNASTYDPTTGAFAPTRAGPQSTGGPQLTAYERATMALEDPGGNPAATSPAGAKGPFQFMPQTWGKYGNGGDPTKMEDALPAMRRLTVDNYRTLAQGLGRQPTQAEIYLAHQQGAAGALALLTHPGEPAGSVVPPANIAANGGDPTAPASSFVGMWTSKFNRALGQPQQAARANVGAPPAQSSPPPSPQGNLAYAQPTIPGSVANRPGGPLGNVPPTPGATVAAGVTDRGTESAPRGAGPFAGANLALNANTPPQAAAGAPAGTPQPHVPVQPAPALPQPQAQPQSQDVAPPQGMPTVLPGHNSQFTPQNYPGGDQGYINDLYKVAERYSTLGDAPSAAIRTKRAQMVADDIKNQQTLAARFGPEAAGARTAAQEQAKAPYEMVETQPVPGGPTMMVSKADLLAGKVPGMTGADGSAPASAFGGIVKAQPPFIAKNQEEMAKTEDQMQQQMQVRQVARERLNQISSILQNYQPGSFAEEKASLVAGFRALGINVPDSATANPAAFQEFTKNQIQNVFADVKAMGGRPLVTEIQGLSKGSANPEMQPDANQKILSQGMGLLDYMDKHTADYFDWKAKNPYAYTTAPFEILWMKQNTPGTYVDAAGKNIAVRGMTIPVDPDKRPVGQLYIHPKFGPVRWEGGKGWKPVTQQP